MTFVTVPKIGTGTDADPIRPDTDAIWWQYVEERDTEFVIKIIQDTPSDTPISVDLTINLPILDDLL